MKKIIATSVFVLFTVIIFAQAPKGTPQGGGKGFTPPNIGRLYGKIIEASSKQPLEFVSVALFTLKDSAIAGTLTKSNGDFNLENLPLGGFNLKITFIGFKKHEQKVFINMQNIEKDLGNISLETDATLLNAVEITEDKSNMSFTIDKKIYNVSKDLSTTGGTGLDAVKNIPSVSVDADGAVTLRNNAVQIFVDGRPTQLTLNQIPSDQIDRIEVISNPSVKFDANTTGGILNVVMKKNTKPGYNGMVMAGIGTNDRYNGMFSLNAKQNKINITSMYNYSTGFNNNNGYTNRENIAYPTPVKYFNLDNIMRSKQIFQFGNLGINYSINNRNSISVSTNMMSGNFINNDVQNYTSSDINNQTIVYGNRLNHSDYGFFNYGGQAIYKKTFPKAGQEWTVDFNTSFTNGNGKYRYETADQNPVLGAIPLAIQTNTSLSNNQMYVFQSDYINPINDSTKIEFGIRSYFKNSHSVNKVNNYSYIVSDFIEDSLLTNDYIIDDLINAAYINYLGKTKKFNYQAGLRFEQSVYTGKILNKIGQDFGYSYPNSANNLLNAIFPGIYLSKKIKSSQEIQLNFSRKINRPNFFQLMPYIMFADKYNYRIGNPNLTPEFVNISEINYNITNKKINYLVSAYGRYTEKPITNISYSVPSDPNVLINTFMNGKNSFSYGIENTLRWTVFKPLSITANLNTFYLNINYIDNKGNYFENSGYSFTSKLTAQYKLPKDFTFQINGTYEAPKIIPQGKTLYMYFFDVSLNKSIKQKFFLNLTLSDMMNTKRMGSHMITSDYIQNLSRRRETRFLRFSVTWMFGKQDASMFKKKPSRNSGTQSGGDDMGF